VSDNPYRLPRAVVPSRYHLVLEPDLDAATFAGTVTIDVAATSAVDAIMLNADELEIDSVRLDRVDVAFHLDPATERLIIDAGLAAVGDATIDIAFRGTLNDKLRGFYRSTFVDDDGNERVIATTQMQATDCRRAFPCFDEPDFKAVFEITLVVDADLFAVSNSPDVSRTERADGKHVVVFKPTMSMSTYLVAFVVGPLEATEPVDVDGIPLRVIHVPGKGHLTGVALDIGAFSLRWYQQYYGIAYPSDKVDMLALPDFAAGAMENLGCITYRERFLLADPDTAVQFELQSLADTVAHEVAHMWFGDLVTMKWWNGIWLNEAFATFMEIACCNDYRPDWQRWATFSLERSMAFETDSLSGRVAERGRRNVRRPHLSEGRVAAAHAGAVPRARRLPTWRQRLLETSRLRQHRDRRPVGRRRGGQPIGAGALDDGLVDLAAWLSIDLGAPRRRRTGARSATVRLRRQR
jgi:puromycin-sensitive aminopeptidase